MEVGLKKPQSSFYFKVFWTFSAKNIEIDFVFDPRPLQPQTTLYDLKRPRTTSNDLGGHRGQYFLGRLGTLNLSLITEK